MLHVFSPRIQSVSLTSSVGSLWTFRNPGLPSVHFRMLSLFSRAVVHWEPSATLGVTGLRHTAHCGMAFPPRTLRRCLPTASRQQAHGGPRSLTGPRVCSVCESVLGAAESVWAPGSTLHGHDPSLRDHHTTSGKITGRVCSTGKEKCSFLLLPLSHSSVQTGFSKTCPHCLQCGMLTCPLLWPFLEVGV